LEVFYFAPTLSEQRKNVEAGAVEVAEQTAFNKPWMHLKQAHAKQTPPKKRSPQKTEAVF
jgi:hypothetical protein